MIKHGYQVVHRMFLPLLAIVFLCSCTTARPQADGSSVSIALIDKQATTETKALFVNLKRLSKNHTLFAHQHATEYGHGWYGDADRSDVKSVTGSHPAMIGVDFSGFTGSTPEANKKEMARVSKVVADTYNRGGVTTVAWHFNNPLSAGGFYWKDSVSVASMQYLKPGGKANDQYKKILQDVANWAKTTLGNDGKQVPVIFRPFHEFDGDWFWWGKGHTSGADFISVWQFTVSYLRDTLGVHSFIYAFSPDNRFATEAQYLERYPGNEYVDLVGMDDYGDMGRDGYRLDVAAKKLTIVSDYAKKNGKLAAFTETGLESLPNPNWWNDVLLKVMQSPGLELCYVLVWRNDSKSPTHYYAPYPGHSNVQDFIKFYNNPYTLFQNNLPTMYAVQ